MLIQLYTEADVCWVSNSNANTGRSEMRIAPVYFLKRGCLFPARGCRCLALALSWLALSKNIHNTHNTWICELITTLATTDRLPKWPSAAIFCFLSKYILSSQPQVHELTLHNEFLLRFHSSQPFQSRKEPESGVSQQGWLIIHFIIFYFLFFFAEKSKLISSYLVRN